MLPTNIFVAHVTLSFSELLKLLSKPFISSSFVLQLFCDSYIIIIIVIQKAELQEARERQREISHHWFTPQMAPSAWARSSWSWEPGDSSGFPNWMPSEEGNFALHFIICLSEIGIFQREEKEEGREEIHLTDLPFIFTF